MDRANTAPGAILLDTLVQNAASAKTMNDSKSKAKERMARIRKVKEKEKEKTEKVTVKANAPKAKQLGKHSSQGSDSVLTITNLGVV